VGVGDREIRSEATIFLIMSQYSAAPVLEGAVVFDGTSDKDVHL